MAAGDREQTIDEGAFLGGGRRPLADDEDIDIAVGPQAAVDGRAVEVRRHGIVAQRPMDHLDDLLDLSPIASIEIGVPAVPHGSL